MTFRIPEDLDASERQQFVDALNWYKQNPTAAPMKFVLGQKSRERVVRMGQEFGIDVYPGTPGPTPTPEPTPTPSDPLARFNSAPSQWAKWHQGFLEPSEVPALKAKYGDLPVDQHINWWDAQGGYKLQGAHRADGSYWFFVPKPPPPGADPAGFYGSDQVQDVGGAADAYVKAELAKPSADFPSGRPMIAPLG